MATLSTVPERTLIQRFEALAAANDIRIRRSALKRDIKAGGKSAEFVILAPQEWMFTMRVRDVLLAMPKYGRVKADVILARCQISPVKTLGGLSERQRRELVLQVRRLAPDPVAQERNRMFREASER